MSVKIPSKEILPRKSSLEPTPFPRFGMQSLGTDE